MVGPSATSGTPAAATLARASSVAWRAPSSRDIRLARVCAGVFAAFICAAAWPLSAVIRSRHGASVWQTLVVQARCGTPPPPQPVNTSAASRTGASARYMPVTVRLPPAREQVAAPGPELDVRPGFPVGARHHAHDDGGQPRGCATVSELPVGAGPGGRRRLSTPHAGRRRPRRRASTLDACLLRLGVL